MLLNLKNEEVLISIHMNKVFSSIYVFIFYTILVNKGVFGSIDGVDCKLLTVLCQNDPSCGNSGVFYKKCLESSETIIEEKEYKNDYYNDYLNILFPLTGLILQNRKKELIDEFLKNGYKFLPTYSTHRTSEEYSTDPYVQLKTIDNNNQYTREYKRKIVRGAIKIIEELLQNEDKSTSAGESIDKKSSVIENRQVSDREDIAVVEYNSPDISHNNDIKPTTTDSYLLANFTTTLDTQNNNTTAIYRIPTKAEEENWDQITLISAIVGGFSIAFFIALALICLVQKQHNQTVLFKKQEAVHDYQELLRTQMSVCALPKPDEIETEENMKQQTWSEDPIPYNMDISTGHAILTYMEDHLKNENRFNKEWEALCNYKSDSDFETKAATDTKNITKNRYQDVVPYDHVRVKLNPVANAFNSDYINASFIRDVREPEYIATQGPLDNTVADFWQMTWEQGVVVIVNLTKLADMGLPQCHRYWPEERSEIYHIYEVHLISEHIWCDDFVVRSLYLKNLQTNETRTVTQFHYLNWPDLSVPSSSRPLLEFRRKVNKCYRGSNHLVLVHCNNGIGRTGTYILLDMILNKMTKGAKEIDIAATLEHLRDQRQDMVKTRGQFDFALTAMAEEVTTILSSVSQR